ncbi:MAG: YggS family pyridoxal phosphate-dependent enzyme [Polyangiaceae bacterium]|nr:YggS family pyridoxal phosphate-dependent enzyme [Polyangiaceae bacterium]
MQNADLSAIAGRLAEVRQRIDAAVARAGRSPGSTRLVAVSKEKPAEAIRAAFAAGQRDFGENYAQELVEKAAVLEDLAGIRWHAIGRIQRNKAKYIARVASVVHAVDRADLATELGKRAAALGRTLEVLVEVSIAGEETKGGCAPAELAGVLDAIAATPSLKAAGLMTMAPFFDDPELSRPVFAALRELRDKHGGASRLPELSMGMSHDFEVAIAEGATLVRVGTAIFGART